MTERKGEASTDRALMRGIAIAAGDDGRRRRVPLDEEEPTREETGENAGEDEDGLPAERVAVVWVPPRDVVEAGDPAWLCDDEVEEVPSQHRHCGNARSREHAEGDGGKVFLTPALNLAEGGQEEADEGPIKPVPQAKGVSIRRAGSKASGCPHVPIEEDRKDDRENDQPLFAEGNRSIDGN